MSGSKPFILVVGARPNFMKIAPLYRDGTKGTSSLLPHTGQHYDEKMSTVFFMIWECLNLTFIWELGRIATPTRRYKIDAV